MKMKKIVTWGLAMGLMASSLFGTSIYAASAGSRKINDTYGTIRGEIEGGKNARSKCFAVESKVSKKGLTLVPLRLYFKQSLIKMELGLCQGKHTYDKKHTLMEKDIKREKERELKNYR